MRAAGESYVTSRGKVVMKQSTLIRTGYLATLTLTALTLLAIAALLLNTGTPTQDDGTPTTAATSSSGTSPETTTGISNAATILDTMRALTADARGFATTGDRAWLTDYFAISENSRTIDTTLESLRSTKTAPPLAAAAATAAEAHKKLTIADIRSMRLRLEADNVPETQMPVRVAEYQLIPADKELTATAKRELAATVVLGRDYRNASEAITTPLKKAITSASTTTAPAAASDPIVPTASETTWVKSWAAIPAIACAIVCLITLIALVRLWHTRTAAPLNRYTTALTSAEPHDLNLTLTPEGTDTTRALAQHFNTRQAALTTSLNLITSDIDRIAATAAELDTSADRFATTSAATSSAAEDAAGTATQLSDNVNTVATGTEEMNVSIREIATAATRASEVASEAVTSAQGAVSIVEKLSESSARIGEVMKTITSIAEQTNLLALNATIEAARAGEAGKGFAVVANEVKELASQSAAASDDISERILGIQGDAEATSAALTSIGEIIARINETQSTIASAVEEQTATTTEMRRSVQEAATGASGIAQTVSQVADRASAGSTAATETRQDIATLSEIAASTAQSLRMFNTHQ
ncbi:hypothetical protein GZ176_03080 [Dermatophilus congolensis]|nr:hypothetical protein [Dermatophilus congolensis]MBO3144682.1 hypothetical protein [Dermatophilus congolensis]MBO3147982.1 hypothetical protein [Dermatophilus congolensis]MBO3150262.1 hypothetical protein [Dermatophilus congolensis]MBO3153673.1 hypothetical protein [Dermatophilus congolensis]